MEYSIGIDVGSTSTKAAVLDQNHTIVLLYVCPTGWSSVDTAVKVKEYLLKKGFNADHIPCVATGYGRISVPFADEVVTEITCHARGAMLLFGSCDMTVIDIGGQDTKIIRIENGRVADFIMNDKCSAGTGRFLEVMANVLGLRPEELCAYAAMGSGASISSMCTVFAESEVISLIGRGESKKNIAHAIVDSIVRKVASQAARLVPEKGMVCLTGGLCDAKYIQDAIGKELKMNIVSAEKGRFAGAIGAAECALGNK